MQEKIEFRKNQKELLKAFSLTEKKKIEDRLITEKLMATRAIAESQTIGITSSLPIEVDTSEIIASLWDAGKEVYLARANSDHSQDFLKYTYRSKIVKSKFGVEEIGDKNAEINNDLDLIIVPGLAFSIEGHERLGFGGGYYDRFLAKHPNSKTIALANSRMIYEKPVWPIEKTDVPIQAIVTTSKIYY